MIVGMSAALGVSATVARTAPVGTARDGLAPVDRTADLEELGRWMKLEQSFSVKARAEADSLLAEYRQRASTFTDADFYMAVRRLVGLAENGHSNVSGGPVYGQFGLLPLRTYWFSDGLYVVRARREHAALIGARITGIDGTSLEELEPRLMEYHGGNRAAFRRFAAMSLLLSPRLLHAIGLAASPDELTLQVVGRDAEAFAATVASEPGPVSAGWVPAWGVLLPRPLPGEGADWVTARDPEATPPLVLSESTQIFRSHRLENDVAYIQLRANIGRQGNTLKDFIKKVERELENDPPRAIVLDNRHNGGGDLTRSAKFASGLPELVSDGGKVYVLTDHGTFSAGIYTSFFPKAAHPDRTIVVGEHVGDFASFWAEAPGPITLPDSGIRIGYAKQFHNLADGCHDRAICHLAGRDRLNIAVGSVSPDITVATNFAHFEAGQDPVLQRVLDEIGESP